MTDQRPTMPVYDPQSGRTIDLAAFIPTDPAAANPTIVDPQPADDTTSTDNT